ncbi:peptidase S41 [Dysgonomonas sp. Marseille-P4677]|uniref:S41 family peptidase n=1 Tax=Dysgonomonas sp. Marseille-P4677 TaxID=2364790 RepID=UPI001A609E3D|nr:S41 family peptidase [Dysgonomonas sp. Marseille-P4677]MBK5721150.1 peptidase S41 [Dysgonomonas sp. Marseille-P4677]
MKSCFSMLFISVLFIIPIKSQERVLTDTEKILGLSRLWEGVRSNFVYYDQLKLDWDSLYEISISKVLEIKETYVYLKELESLAASVKDGHTYVYHRGDIPREDRITPAPFTTQFVEGKVLVDKIWSSSLIDKGVKRGTEVVSIDGIDVVTYAEEVLGKYIPSSTPQWLYHNTFSNYELTKGRRTIPITVGFREKNKNITISIDRNMIWDIQKKERAKNNGKDIEEEYYSIKYELLDNNIGLLTIKDFMSDSMNDDFDKIYENLLTSDGLIIDIRNNGGGNSSRADYILRHLIDKPIESSKWSSRMYIPTHASWNYPAEWYSGTSKALAPIDKEIYKKPVMILINAGTFSSAEDLSVRFKSAKRGLIVGSPTGGSTGNGVRITLIEGLAWANICARKDVAPDGTVFVGVGVLPDIEVHQTKNTFLSDRDIVLEKAVDQIKSNLSGK